MRSETTIRMYRLPIRLHELAVWFHRHKMYRARGLVNFMTRVLCSCDIATTATIGEGTLFVHYGIGVVIGGEAKIGRNVRILQNVTLGDNGSQPGMPTIEDDVYIGAGAKIIGPVTIGRGAVIGANSVVTKDIPAGSIAAGIPARIIRMADKNYHR